MDILNHRTFQLAEEHRRQLLRDAGADREDVLRHRLELHRSRPRRSPGPSDLLQHIGRRLGRALVAWLAVVAIAGCGTHLSAGAGVSTGHVTSGWHDAPVEGAPEAVSCPEHIQASAPTANATRVTSDYPPQERDVPELSSLLRSALMSQTDDDRCLWRDCSGSSVGPASICMLMERPAIGQRARCTADRSICGLVPELYRSEP